MRKGILGRKMGMTGVFTKSGELIPVTVISVEPNVVTQIKTIENDGYEAIQLGFETKRKKLSNKPEEGHVGKSNTSPKRFFREIRDVKVEDYSLGQVLDVEIFNAGEIVDVSGISKGKGFQGSIKRHNFSKGPMSHGSRYHRGSGSLGSMQPMRVFKGKKLPGRMGAVLTTVQNLEIIKVDKENNVLLIKGNVPGPKKAMIMIRNAIKNLDSKNDAAQLISYKEEINLEETAVSEKE